MIEKYKAFEKALQEKLSYDQLYKEMEAYTMSLNPNSTLEMLMANFAIVQGYKDRVCKLLLDAMKNTSKFQRIYEILFDMEFIITEGKNEKERTASVNTILREFLDAFKDAKDYEASVKMIYNNLQSCNENVSRMLSVISEQLKLGENPQLRR